MTEEDRYDEFAKRMAEKYPRYFGESKHYGGFCIGEGWYDIIESLVSEIDSYTKWRRNMRAYDLRLARAKRKGRDSLLNFICRGREPKLWDESRADEIMDNNQRDITPKFHWIEVNQIKEKFGGLRFYYSGGDDHISGLVNMAESWAGHTCEECGNKGKSREGGWIRTLCDHHEAERQKKMKEYNE